MNRTKKRKELRWKRQKCNPKQLKMKTKINKNLKILKRKYQFCENKNKPKFKLKPNLNENQI